MKEKWTVNSSLLELVLPLDNELSDFLLHELMAVLQGRQVTCDQWLQETSHISQLGREVLEQIYHVTLDFINSEMKTPDACLVSGHLLAFSLFLQKISLRGKRSLGQRKKLADDEVLAQFLSESLETLSILFEGKFLAEILSLIFNESEVTPKMEELLSDSPSIVPDQCGVMSCIKSGKKLAWKLGNRTTANKAKMATTASVGGGGRKMIVLSTLNKQTLVKDSQTVRGSSLLVHRCGQSQLFFPTRLESLQLSRCVSVLVVVGSVKRTVRIKGCRNSTVIVTARRIVIQECLNCTFYLYTPNKPLLGITCHNLTFAPLNLNYSGLEEDMRKAGLDPRSKNLWDSPLLLSTVQVERQMYQLLPSKQFDLAMFPVSSLLWTPLVALPQQYSEALQEKTDRVERWNEELSRLKQSQHDVIVPLVNNKYNSFPFLESVHSHNIDINVMISNIECDEIKGISPF